MTSWTWRVQMTSWTWRVMNYMAGANDVMDMAGYDLHGGCKLRHGHGGCKCHQVKFLRSAILNRVCSSKCSLDLVLCDCYHCVHAFFHLSRFKSDGTTARVAAAAAAATAEQPMQPPLHRASAVDISRSVMRVMPRAAAAAAG